MTAAIFRHEDGWRDYDSLTRIGPNTGGGQLRLERVDEREILLTPWPFRARCQVIDATARSFPVLPPEQLVHTRSGQPAALRWPLVCEPVASA